jgi:hypothetical protein
MFLGSYRFDGDPSELLAGYDRLMASMEAHGAALMLHACVADDTGITVYDTCPSRDVFHGFSTSADFAGALEAAGLPSPVVSQLGDVHRAQLFEKVVS